MFGGFDACIFAVLAIPTIGSSFGLAEINGYLVYPSADLEPL
jgi:hypothetical protein